MVSLGARRIEMDWERWFCPNQRCFVEFWMVQQASHNRELWLMTDRFGGGSFTVAAEDPVCPRCGETLCMTVEIAQRSDGDLLETGPMYEFVRSLR
jgi:hypothetical protein